MPCPFCLQSLVFLCKEDFNDIKERTPFYKLKFCIEFEQELGLEKSSYSDNVFDYIFNIFYVKPAYDELAHRKIVHEFLGLDFTNNLAVNAYIEKSYGEIILNNKKYIMQLFRIDHDDPIFAAKVFQKNIEKNVEILTKGIF